MAGQVHWPIGSYVSQQVNVFARNGEHTQNSHGKIDSQTVDASPNRHFLPGRTPRSRVI
jgi:hypothetical protein